MKLKTSTQTTETKTIRLSGEDIVQLLREKGLISETEQVKQVFVQVPGGADWSNCELSLEDDEEVQVVIKNEYYS